MLPFRELLSSANPFTWSKELDEAFQASKEDIVRLVKHGVEMYDP